ncbi:MAG TPA: TetR/AcrR family transcriptional regulator [Solirubrobacteraceae bacterium]
MAKTRPYKQVARAEAQQRTQIALLNAADEEIYEGRWPKASLERLATRAGVTKQTLLRHFGSKDGLLLHALIRGAAQVRDQRWRAPRGDIDGAVTNLLDHYEAWGERSLRIGAWLDGPALLAEISKAARQVHHEWVDYVFGSWLEGIEEPLRTHRRAALIAICDVHAWWLLARDLELPRAEVHATLSEAIERLLGGEARPPGSKPESNSEPSGS